MEVQELNLEYEELVTVEVLPQTVNDIIYMSAEDVTKQEISEEEKENDDGAELYEIGTVDTSRLFMPLVLDESQSFVFLSQDTEEYVIKQDSVQCQYICSICDMNFNSLNKLSIHRRLIHKISPKNEFACKECGCPFEKAQALSKHFKTSHQFPKLICSICGCPCSNKTALLCHYKKHEPKAYSCDLCSADFDNAVSLNNHLKTHSTLLLYACNKCDAEFSSTSEVSAHLRYMHANAERDTYLKGNDGKIVPVKNKKSGTMQVGVQNNKRTKGEEK